MMDPWDDDTLRTHARKRGGGRWIARIALAAGLCCFVGVVAWSAYALMADKKTTKKQIVQISLLKPPPPPPPSPPPPEQKLPEPEVKQKVEVPEPEQPKQADEAPPASEQLGLDSDGSGSGDGFGLAAKKGGRDITTIGGDGGGSRFAWFTGLVQNKVQEQLERSSKLHGVDYKVVLRVWFERDGRLARYELLGSTGNAQVDQNLRLALDEMPPLKQAPPETMPQPVKLRVTSRGAG